MAQETITITLDCPVCGEEQTTYPDVDEDICEVSGYVRCEECGALINIAISYEEA